MTAPRLLVVEDDPARVDELLAAVSRVARAAQLRNDGGRTLTPSMGFRLA